MDREAWHAAIHGVVKSRTRLSSFTFTFHFHALEREMATHSSVLAWRIPGMPDQRVDLAFQRQFVEVAGELVQRVALGLAALLALALAAGHAGGRLVADLGDAVRD